MGEKIKYEKQDSSVLKMPQDLLSSSSEVSSKHRRQCIIRSTQT